MEVDMDKEMKASVSEVHGLVDNIEEVIDGRNIGIIISSLLLLLAELYDEEVMPLDTYLAEINRTIRGLVQKRDEFNGETQWLQ
jgi:hypothetical protein